MLRVAVPPRCRYPKFIRTATILYQLMDLLAQRPAERTRMQFFIHLPAGFVNSSQLDQITRNGSVRSVRSSHDIGLHRSHDTLEEVFGFAAQSLSVVIGCCCAGLDIVGVMVLSGQVLVDHIVRKIYLVA